ncbi:ATP-binding protein [Streptomyces sp. NPDC057301]|uniref:ATP-binding protein n=1 Tax=Streptomyces sp. NPDC057301 TaxID=3346093 RepID=UPI00362CA4E1
MASAYPHSMGLTFPASKAAAVGARRLTSYALACWGLAHLLDEARLVVTELVDNAVKAIMRHEPSPREVDVRLMTAGHSLMIEVEDPLPDWLPDAHEGRGLRLISAMSDDWGVRQSTEGKTVWASLSGEQPTYLSGGPWPAVGEPWRRQNAGTGRRALYVDSSPNRPHYNHNAAGLRSPADQRTRRGGPATAFRFPSSRTIRPPHTIPLTARL